MYTHTKRCIAKYTRSSWHCDILTSSVLNDLGMMVLRTEELNKNLDFRLHRGNMYVFYTKFYTLA